MNLLEAFLGAISGTPLGPLASAAVKIWNDRGHADKEVADAKAFLDDLEPEAEALWPKDTAEFQLFKKVGDAVAEYWQAKHPQPAAA